MCRKTLYELASLKYCYNALEDCNLIGESARIGRIISQSLDPLIIRLTCWVETDRGRHPDCPSSSPQCRRRRPPMPSSAKGTLIKKMIYVCFVVALCTARKQLPLKCGRKFPIRQRFNRNQTQEIKLDNSSRSRQIVEVWQFLPMIQLCNNQKIIPKLPKCLLNRA